MARSKHVIPEDASVAADRIRDALLDLAADPNATQRDAKNAWADIKSDILSAAAEIEDIPDDVSIADLDVSDHWWRKELVQQIKAAPPKERKRKRRTRAA